MLRRASKTISETGYMKPLASSKGGVKCSVQRHHIGQWIQTLVCESPGCESLVQTLRGCGGSNCAHRMPCCCCYVDRVSVTPAGLWVQWEAVSRAKPSQPDLLSVQHLPAPGTWLGCVVHGAHAFRARGVATGPSGGRRFWKGNGLLALEHCQMLPDAVIPLSLHMQGRV